MSATDTINKMERVQIQKDDVQQMMDRFHYSQYTKNIIEKENLLPAGLLSRLHNAFPHRSGIMESRPFMFTEKDNYYGLKGLREINEILLKNGIDIGYMLERELFIKVYRFMVTRHVLNTINWDDFNNDSLFQLVFPQPGMIKQEMVDAYRAATSDEERERLIDEYMKQTNPHDGKQKLNKPYYEEEDGTISIVEGSQHKYPQCKLIFDKTTQNCFAFCSYCFRHAQVRGDEDMFIQKEVEQVHHYIRQHKEITDVLITGGDASYMPYERMKAYVMPLITDPEMAHVKTLRLGTRVLTFDPELILTKEYENILGLFRELTDNGIRVAYMSHFSTPREALNISTIAAIRRLRAAGVTVKSQSPIMNHISMFTKENGEVDVDKSAQNWIDLGHVLGMLTVGFHSMYCARPTGEHHYFTVPLKYINQVFSKIYRELPSISRPSRYITMTSSAGKISMLGETEVNGEKAFALKFNEGRNMEWMDKVFLAKYDEVENTIANLKPLDTDKHFFEDELEQIENKLEETFIRKMEQNK